MNLSALGIKYIMEALKDEEGLVLGRIALEHKRLYRVWTEEGEWLAEISGRLRFEAESRGDYPAVGDWVYMRPRGGEKKGIITEVVPRFSKFSRKAAVSRRRNRSPQQTSIRSFSSMRSVWILM